MKNWTNSALISAAILVIILMIVLGPGTIGIPSLLWLAVCLAVQGVLIFLIIGLFTKNSSTSDKEDSSNSLNKNNENNFQTPDGKYIERRD